jgi:hypothetical protein
VKTEKTRRRGYVRVDVEEGVGWALSGFGMCPHGTARSIIFPLNSLRHQNVIGFFSSAVNGAIPKKSHVCTKKHQNLEKSKPFKQHFRVVSLGILLLFRVPFLGPNKNELVPFGIDPRTIFLSSTDASACVCVGVRVCVVCVCVRWAERTFGARFRSSRISFENHESGLT